MSARTTSTHRWTSWNGPGLAKGDRRLGHGASFLFELLDPKTRLPIPSPYDRRTEFDVHNLTREDITNYFTFRLSQWDIGPDHQNPNQ